MYLQKLPSTKYNKKLFDKLWKRIRCPLNSSIYGFIDYDISNNTTELLFSLSSTNILYRVYDNLKVQK